jgi:hypothetical protein
MGQWDSQDVERGGFPTLSAEFDELRNLKRLCPRARLSPYESGSSVQFTILAVAIQRGVGRKGEGVGREEMDVGKTQRVKAARRWSVGEKCAENDTPSRPFSATLS